MNKYKRRKMKEKIDNNKYKFLFLTFFVFLFLFSSGYALYNRTFNITGEATIKTKTTCTNGITGDFEVINSWGENEIGVINVENTTEETLNGFEIEMKLPKGTILSISGIEESVNGEVVVPDSGIVTLTSVDDEYWLWQSQIPPGSWSLRIGIKYIEIDFDNKLYPDWINLNGCNIYGESDEQDLTLRSLNINPNNVSVAVGGTENLNLQKSPSNSTANITWTSSDTSVATVNENGVVTGVSVGTATITATSGEISTTATVTVNEIVLQSLTISPSTYRMTVGEMVNLIATKNPENATGTISWTSSDTSVVSVDSSGMILGISEGTATITATSGEISATATITVVEPTNVSDIEIDFNIDNVWTETTGTFSAVLTNNSDETINKIIFDVLMPDNTEYTFWWNVISNEGNTLTFNNQLAPGASINWGGSISLESGNNINDYITPTIYNIRTE